MIYRFDDFTLDDELFELRHTRQRIRVQPRVLDLLLFLIRSRSKIVSKQELLTALWGNVVVSPTVLTTAMHEVRKVLDDSKAKQWAIETIPGRGYRFVAIVEEEAQPGGSGSNRARIASAPLSPSGSNDECNGLDSASARLRAWVKSAWTGGSRIVMLSCASEIDRTHLIGDVTLALDRQVEVLDGPSSAETGAPPYWPWIQILRSAIEARSPVQLQAEIGSGAPILAGLVPELRSRLPAIKRRSCSSPSESSFALFDSTASFLRRSAARSPIVILLNDLHWADTPSLQMLEFVAQQTRQARLAMVIAFSETEPASRHPRLAESLTTVLRHSAVEQVAVGDQLDEGVSPPLPRPERILRER